MSIDIENYILKKDICGALEQCIREKQYNFGLLLGKIWMYNNKIETDNKIKSLLNELEDNIDESSTEEIKKPDKITSSVIISSNSNNNIDDKIRVLCICNWTSSIYLCQFYNRMSKGNFTWNNIRIVSEEPCDYYVIINSPNSPQIDTDISSTYPKEKTILFRMEPNMQYNNQMWKQWSNPNKDHFLFAGFHEEHYNNIEWHLSLTYNQLMSCEIIKDSTLNFSISTIISNKYSDIGHKKRIDFLKFLDTKDDIILHVFGTNNHNWKHYKGVLPDKEKDNGLLPYKYTFNAENNVIHNYFTEKIVDGILSECLTVYFGCPNLSEYINNQAFVKLELEDFEKDYNTLKKMYFENWWSQRIHIIKQEKRKILNELHFFPRLEKIINKNLELNKL